MVGLAFVNITKVQQDNLKCAGKLKQNTSYINKRKYINTVIKYSDPAVSLKGQNVSGNEA